MINGRRLTDSFMTMASIDSVSRRERKMADYLCGVLKDLGFVYEEDDTGREIGGTAGNIIARLAGTAPGPSLLFCTHMDTVEPGIGVHPRIEGHSIQSAGDTILGADDKAGIAAVLEAVRVIRDEKLPHPPLELVFTVAEEVGLLGAKALDSNALESTMAFVLDSDGAPGKVVTRAPSQDGITAVVIGRAAHAGINPEEGVNAIQAAAAALVDLPLGRVDEETTANIGIVRGGQATNIVPDRVHLEGETRSLDEVKRRAISELICRKMTERAEAAGARVKIEVELLYPSFDLDEGAAPVRLALESARNLGLETSVRESGGGSDANVLNQYGIPTVNLSTGMRKVHTTKEMILIEDLHNIARQVLEIIRLAVR